MKITDLKHNNLSTIDKKYDFKARKEYEDFFDSKPKNQTQEIELFNPARTYTGQQTRTTSKTTPSNTLTKKKPNYVSWGLGILLVIAIIIFAIGVFNWVESNQDRWVNQVPATDKYNDTEIELAYQDNSPNPISESLSEIGQKANTQAYVFEENQEIDFEPAVDPALYKSFSGQGFADFYQDYSYAGITQIETPPEITTIQDVDKIIQTIAEGRGYKLRGNVQVDKLTVVDGQQLYSEVVADWLAMKTAASREGLSLVLVSGYRSIDEQRDIFMSNLNGISLSEILAGNAEAEINEILETVSIPGYSRHHNGYTIDIGCQSTNLTNFKETKCFEWISSYNYLNAKRFGFIPSYPAGAENQGPEPEEWEYVWVGETNLRN